MSRSKVVLGTALYNRMFSDFVNFEIQRFGISTILSYVFKKLWNIQNAWFMKACPLHFDFRDFNINQNYYNGVKFILYNISCEQRCFPTLKMHCFICSQVDYRAKLWVCNFCFQRNQVSWYLTLNSICFLMNIVGLFLCIHYSFPHNMLLYLSIISLLN